MTSTHVGHTPGPWYADSDNSDASIGIYDHDWSAIPRTNGVNFIAKALWLGECATETQKANARLIAAAPDLLAACRVALAYLEDNLPKGNIRNNFYALNNHENGVCKPLRAAIAKATGGEA